MFDSLKKMFEKNAKTISLKAVEDGRTIPMDEVNDQTFAQELLGPGIAIVPSNGTVVSPINGTIATVMDTKHAVCIPVSYTQKTLPTKSHVYITVVAV